MRFRRKVLFAVLRSRKVVGFAPSAAAADIHFDEKLPTRLVVQVDSLARVTGTPSTVIADELHGIYRLNFSNPSLSKSMWERFDGLITTAKHFIALDADASDDDKKILSMMRPGIKFIINDYKPDIGKRFYLENSNEENYQLTC